MAAGVTIFIIAVIIIVIWLIIEAKRMRHKLFAIFLILLILFSYFSFILALKGKDIDYSTPGGFVDAAGLYFSWLGHVFVNFKTITANAIKMDWKAENKTTEK